jgi:lysophospholipase L1-like esterase
MVYFKRLVFVLVLLASFSFISKVGDGNASGFPFARSMETSLNRIDFAADLNFGERFSGLITMASKGAKPIRILHIGDSHIQADIFTGETRRLLSWWLSDSAISRGFTFPYRIAGSNGPADFRETATGLWTNQRVTTNGIPDRMGVAGIVLNSLSGESSINFRLKNINGANQLVDQIRVYIDGLHSPSEITIPLASMDELREGVASFKFDCPTDSFSIILNGQTVSNGIRFYGLELVNSSSRVLYHSAGLNGASVSSYLLSENLYDQVVAINPQVIILSLGTNDAFNDAFKPSIFSQNLRELVKKITYAMPSAIVILTTPGDHYIRKHHPNERLMQASSEIVQIAAEMGCGVWDFYSLMGGKGSMKQWLRHGLSAPDMIHLSEKGYKLQGEMLFRALVGLTPFDADVPINQQ